MRNLGKEVGRGVPETWPGAADAPVVWLGNTLGVRVD
jgi:hypothetical protein